RRAVRPCATFCVSRELGSLDVACLLDSTAVGSARDVFFHANLPGLLGARALPEQLRGANPRRIANERTGVPHGIGCTSRWPPRGPQLPVAARERSRALHERARGRARDPPGAGA